ncbi:MAG: SDR family oxidoreductase, partial [Chloroflexota bacterium]|nr:SDR family oxidoreductase [Chloroflexota bacterium]
MASKLEGKVTLITGAGSGIGRAAAVRLAQEGGSLILVGRREAPLHETAGMLGGADALIQSTDISDPTSVDDVIRATLEKYDRLDVLVNAAGLNVPKRSLADCSIEDYQTVIAADLNGAFYLTRGFLQTMRRQGDGTVINIVSDSGWRGNNFAGVAYIAAKFGLRGLTEAINAEERQHGIRATSIYPGEVNTPILDRRPMPPPPEARAKML